MTVLSRRSMLTGAAVAAATAAVVVDKIATTPAAADETAELNTFVVVSVGITGIAQTRIAPSVDPVDIKRQYFAQAKMDPAFGKLIAAVGGETDPAKAATIVMNNADPAIKYLGRAILLAWYTGCWYRPDTLRQFSEPKPSSVSPDPQKVISEAAYTQGWNWRVAQTHPMGYSEFIYGYWHKDPQPLADFIGKPV